MRTLTDCTALIVEDETILAFNLVETLNDGGCKAIHVAANEAAARLIIHKHMPDVAVLDIHLGRHTSFPIADMLALQRTPFIFVSADPPEAVPEHHRHRPLVRKPYLPGEVIKTLQRILNPDEASDTQGAQPTAAEHTGHLDSDLASLREADPDE